MKRIFRIILPLFCMALLIGECEKKDHITESGTNATETLAEGETASASEIETTSTIPEDDTELPRFDIACLSVNGGASWGDVKQYANEVIPVIQTNDPNAVILVETPKPGTAGG